MLAIRSISRTLLASSLILALSAVTPVIGAPAVPMPLHDVMQIALMPAQAPQPGTPAAPSGTPAAPAADQSNASTGATPAKSRLPKWAWAAIAVGAGAAVGAGVLAANRQSGHTASVTPGATLQSGGAPTVGAP